MLTIQTILTMDNSNNSNNSNNFDLSKIIQVAIDLDLFKSADMIVQLYLLIMLPFMILLNFVQNMKYLSIASSCALLLQITGILIIFYELFTDLPPTSTRSAVGDSIPLYFSTVCFAFEGISIVREKFFLNIFWEFFEIFFGEISISIFNF
jgi:hypothetical protein